MRTKKASRTKYYEHVIPGGWEVRVPSITIARGDPRFSEMTTLLRSMGASQSQAEQIVILACQELFEGSWQTKLKMVVGRAAEKYHEMHGDLEGFDPEKVQDLFIPGGDQWKGRRNLAVEKMLREMKTSSS